MLRLRPGLTLLQVRRRRARILPMQRLMECVGRLARPKVALAGDFLLDRYLYGDCGRISPEAPVPVLRVVDRESRPGGAGSVAAGILALGAQVRCVGVIGQDAAGDELLGMLTLAGAETSALLRLGGRATTVKQRLIGLAQHRHQQQMLRMDEEPTDPVPKEVHVTLRASLRSVLQDCQCLALTDYDKGLFTDVELPMLIADARSAGVPVVVDPAPITDYRRYRGATLVTPNRYEAEMACGVALTDEPSMRRCAQCLLDVTDAEAVIITLDRDGAYLLPRGGEGVRVPTRPRSVYDVTGAGDAVLATLAVCVAAGLELPDAVALANVAGGLEVERFGSVPVSRAEIVAELRRMVGLRSGKVMGRKRLFDELARRQRGGETVVFTNGCFDLLHLGHVRYFQKARELGTCLVVAVNSDDSTARLKGPTRPVIGQDERAEMLAALECVDYVTIFDEDTPEALLDLLRPNVLCKGGSTPQIVGQAFVEGYGGEVIKLDLVEGLSTTDIINRILSAHDVETSQESAVGTGKGEDCGDDR